MKKISKKELELYLITKDFSVRDTAKNFNVCPATIYKKCKKYNINIRDAQKNSIKNKKYGRLTTIKISGKDRHGKSKWLCKCECGKEIIVNASSLKRGLTKSCGCLKHELNYKGFEKINGSYWNCVKKSANDRGFSFEIKIEEAWNLYLNQNKKCALTGVDIKFVTNNDKQKFQTASLDRIDSNKNYTIDNVWWIHKRVNRMKSVIPKEELIFWCHKIVENYPEYQNFDSSKIGY